MEITTSRNKLSKDNYIKYSAIASQMLILIVAGVLLGQFLDKKFETDKLFTAICSLFFVLASIYLALKDFIKK